MLTKLWAVIYATGSAIVEQHRRTARRECVIVGKDEGIEGRFSIWPEMLERRINHGLTTVSRARDDFGKPVFNERGYELYECVHAPITLGSYEIMKHWSAVHNKRVYRVLPKYGTPEFSAMYEEGLPMDEDEPPKGITKLLANRLGPQWRRSPSVDLGYDAPELPDAAPQPQLACAETMPASAAQAGGSEAWWSTQILPDKRKDAALVAKQLAAVTATFQQQNAVMQAQLAALQRQMEALGGSSRPDGGLSA